MRKTITILQVPIDQITRKEAAKKFVDFCHGEKQAFTATPNAEIILEAQKNSELLSYLQRCELNTADSVSLLWAGMVQEKKWSELRSFLELLALPFRKSSWGEAFPERVSGSDLFWEVCKEAEKQGKSIFLMGAMGDTAERAKDIVQKRFPSLKLLGGIPGSPKEKDDEEMRKIINEVQPDILFLAYGCPAQELWIERNLQYCPSVKAAMGIGGTFDFIAGNIKRAPKIFQSLGLEWLWRLILQPSRWKRIFRAVVVFPCVFLRQLLH